MKLGLTELFARNSAYVPLYRAALKACLEPCEAEVVREAIESQRLSASQIQSAASILETLVRNAAIEVSVTVDGEPYEGTLHDVQEDENVSPDADVRETYRTTDEGAAVLDSSEPSSRIASLIEKNPEFAPGFYTVLELCSEDGGKSTRELQEALRAAGALPRSASNGMETVHASYYTGALENAGALEWRGSRWHATEAGRRA